MMSASCGVSMPWIAKHISNGERVFEEERKLKTSLEYKKTINIDTSLGIFCLCSFLASSCPRTVDERACHKEVYCHSLRRAARFLAAARFPCTFFSNAWSSAPCCMCSSRIYVEMSGRALEVSLCAYLLELVQLSIRLVRGLVRASLGENLLEAAVYLWLMKLLAIVRQALDEFLDRPIGLERKQ